MDNTTKRATTPRELVLAVVAATVLSIAFGKYWYKPRKLSIANEIRLVEETNKKLIADQEVFSDLQKIDSESEQPRGQDPRITVIREANSSFANIIKKLSGTDDPDLFSIKNIAVEKEESFSEYSKVLFSLELEAPFLHVGRFLETLEKSDLLTEVVDIEANRIEPELKRCSVKLKLYSYVNRL
ncbi:hypothetical protein EBZ37_04855 [bacterium]|nr:hypothetical protein [bacterium]